MSPADRHLQPDVGIDRIRCVRAAELGPDELARWRELQLGLEGWDSAFLTPELARVIDGIRPVEVAVLESGGVPVGVFPFERGPRGVAQAPLGRLSEFHGVLLAPGVRLDPRRLLRELGLKAWHFDHVPSGQTDLAPATITRTDSPLVRLEQGFAAYRKEARSSGGGLVKNLERKGRKLEREAGELGFRWHDASPEPLERLFEWKTEQHRRTGVLEVLRVEWVREALARLRDTEQPGFRGLLSTLHAGDRLVAVHLGLVGPRAVHVWFPAYDPEFASYSPGGVLMMRLIEATAGSGLARLDFGRGSERYKRSLANGAIELLEGSVDRRPVARLVRGSWARSKRAIRASRFSERLEAPLRATRKVRQWLAFR